MKAEHDCAGDINQDGLSNEFKPFSPQEIE